MYTKLKDSGNLYDHEILEILLFYVFPRVNTNPIAHNLLGRFGSIDAVLHAEIDELKEVDGVGDGVANFLRVVGLCTERAKSVNEVRKIVTGGDFKEFVEYRFKGKREEYLEIYLLDKGGKILRVLSYSDSKKNTVQVHLKDITREIALVKPNNLLLAHNHPNGNPNPSADDISFTSAVHIACMINCVDLQDHIIYTEDKLFSFRDEYVLDKIKSECNIGRLAQWTES